MKPIREELKRPLQYVERTWLRRATLIVGSPVFLVVYMIESIDVWFKDCRKVWRGVK